MWKAWKLRAVHLVTYWLVKNLLKAVHEDDLLTQKAPGKWYLGQRRLRPEEVSELAAEARDFKKSFLWTAMTRDIRYIAFIRATSKATSSEDLIYSSAMYYDLQILEGFMQKLIDETSKRTPL